MSYIVVAEVSLTSETNLYGDIALVNARVLSQTESQITFDLKGDFTLQKEITSQLCSTLIATGFIEFEIRHSY
jgi:hypothetical protein